MFAKLSVAPPRNTMTLYEVSAVPSSGQLSPSPSSAFCDADEPAPIDPESHAPTLRNAAPERNTHAATVAPRSRFISREPPFEPVQHLQRGKPYQLPAAP